MNVLQQILRIVFLQNLIVGHFHHKIENNQIMELY